MTNQEVIQKYRLEIGIGRPDGSGKPQEGIIIQKSLNPTPEAIAYIREHKAEIMAEIKAETTRKEQAEKEIKQNTVKTYLSSRGWGDYSPVEISADLRKTDSQLLAECREALNNQSDVDQANQSDEELLARIAEARKKHSAPKVQVETAEHGPGYCYNCESYCYGDCGDYQPVLTKKIIAKRAKEAMREDDYGVND